MSGEHPVSWANGKRSKLKSYALGAVGEWTRKARDVCMPGVPVAALLGFAANGDAYNTTGWRVGDETERRVALGAGRRPFIKGDPRVGYGAIGSDDLHELGYYGVEAGHCPTPVATDPSCPWVTGARAPEVRTILGRDAVTGGAWYGKTADLCVVGVWNVARHGEFIRTRLPASLQWAAGTWDVFGFFATMSAWSAGDGRADHHFSAYEAALAPLSPAQRVGEFLRRAAAVDDPGNRHAQDEYTALRSAQKWSAGIIACEFTGEDPSWFADGLSDSERAAVYARLVAIV